ncbi:UDP-glucose 4-epimerase family protein [Bermanella sp. R86510]|uniref:UDP-glucose 4-epimerase family protein n=1 Tax=unclassified Bermanella TaxID=2627862 RepID=UPI0037CC024F
MRVLVTGANGFLGSYLIKVLSLNENALVSLAVRSKSSESNVRQFSVGNISSQTSWSKVVDRQDVVIHCAAMSNVNAQTDEKALKEVNVAGTLKLATDASKAGVKRFIFISSIKVNGESTSGSEPFDSKSERNPQDSYGKSKSEAEDKLIELGNQTGMEIVIIRPPLVYGRGVKANFLNLMIVSATGLPLPFGLISNQRSMIYLGNLVDFIINCIDHPAAKNQTFLVSDGQDLSLSNLIRLIRSAMNRPALLMPVPVSLFKLVGKLTGKTAVVDRLVGDLQVDSSKARHLLDWTPPYTVEAGIKETVNEFMSRKK